MAGWMASQQKVRSLLFVLLCWNLCAPAFMGAQDESPADSTKPDLVLQGEVHGSQNNSYVEVPFQVPAGVRRVTLTFAYTERDQHTALDLGLLDPSKLRCWSGGNKSTLTVGESDATPSCLPGPIPQGEWKVLIGVPNIRSTVTSHYTAQVFFTKTGLVADEPEILREPLRKGPGWYRGDLHMHTGHSDGQCPSQSGKMVPCPVFVTVEAATKRGLDFIAITDHNATSQYDAMRELQPYFDKILLIPGREITTFQGHLNVLGTTQDLDFRLDGKNVPDANTLLRNIRATGALVSINHPAAPTGEICMGCGWTPSTPVDMHFFSAIEAVNGGSQGDFSPGIAFWEQQLHLGYRLTAIGGSDNHRPVTPLENEGSIGRPTTVVYAQTLSTPDILKGIRSGRVFIDLTGSSDRLLDLQAATKTAKAAMGDEIAASAGEDVAIDLQVSKCRGAVAHFLVDGHGSDSMPDQKIEEDEHTFHVHWKSDGTRHWISAQITDSSGQILLLGNAIYSNWQTQLPASSR